MSDPHSVTLVLVLLLPYLSCGSIVGSIRRLWVSLYNRNAVRDRLRQTLSSTFHNPRT